MKQNYQNPQGEDQKKGKMECIEYKLQWKVLLFGSVYKHDATLQLHMPRLFSRVNLSWPSDRTWQDISHVFKNRNAYDNKATFWLGQLPQSSLHSHHSLTFNYNKDPAYIMEVHKIFYLTFICNIFSLGDIAKESQGKDPELLVVAVTKQHQKFPHCSFKYRLLQLLR